MYNLAFFPSDTQTVSMILHCLTLYMHAICGMKLTLLKADHTNLFGLYFHAPKYHTYSFHFNFDKVHMNKL